MNKVKYSSYTAGFKLKVIEYAEEHSNSGCEKQCCTAMLAIAMDRRKLPLYVIFKRKTVPKAKLPNGVHVRVQGKVWMDAAMVCDWVCTVWIQRPGTLLRRPSLLVWNRFHRHLGNSTKRILMEMKTDIAVIPRGLTSVLQPLMCQLTSRSRTVLENCMRNGWQKVDMS
jgi:hypothetical protein